MMQVGIQVWMFVLIRSITETSSVTTNSECSFILSHSSIRAAASVAVHAVVYIFIDFYYSWSDLVLLLDYKNISSFLKFILRDEKFLNIIQK